MRLRLLKSVQIFSIKKQQFSLSTRQGSEVMTAYPAFPLSLTYVYGYTHTDVLINKNK